VKKAEAVCLSGELQWQVDSGRKQQSIFPLDQRPMNAQRRRRPDSNRNLREAIGGDPEGTDAEQEPIPGSHSRSSIARSVGDDLLNDLKE
jgi:hypothetical protein